MSIEAIHRAHHQMLLDAHAAHLRGEGYTFRQIAEEMGCNVRAAHDRVMRAYGRMPGPKAAAERNRMLAELDDMALACYEVLERSHVTVNNRGVVTVDVIDPVTREKVGEIPVPDDRPVLEAVDRLLRIQERRAKLLGTDAPAKRSVEVITRTAILDAIAEMERELGEVRE